MRYVNVFAVVALSIVLAGCDVLGKQNSTTLPGTDTAIVGLYVDKNGYPQSQVEKVTVYPGQRVVFAGPNQFDILFKDEKSPIGRLEVPSTNGIVVIDVPADIFERDQRESKAGETKKEIRYRYGIRVDGKVTDPEIVIARR
jgi:hypothetical protein